MQLKVTRVLNTLFETEEQRRGLLFSDTRRRFYRTSREFRTLEFRRGQIRGVEYVGPLFRRHVS